MCSCCGKDRPDSAVASLKCHDDVKVCRECIGWLNGRAGGIDVTPGETLTLRLADTGAVLFGWRYGNDTYPKGHAVMLNRADRRFDFAFRAHDAISAASDPR